MTSFNSLFASLQNIMWNCVTPFSLRFSCHLASHCNGNALGLSDVMRCAYWSKTPCEFENRFFVFWHIAKLSYGFTGSITFRVFSSAIRGIDTQNMQCKSTVIDYTQLNICLFVFPLFSLSFILVFFPSIWLSWFTMDFIYKSMWPNDTVAALSIKLINNILHTQSKTCT